MRTNQLNRCIVFGVLIGAACAYSESEYAGLWVGSVAVSHVNEVAVPLDENNVPIAPNPNVPTPTHDQAYLRLILHVNGAGQVNLLRDVAILSQSVDGTSGSVAQSESDYVLVTDDRLYADFPAQEAIRIASAVFDYGDSSATDAVDQLIETIITNVAASVDVVSLVATSADTLLRSAEAAAQLAGETEAKKLITPSDVNDSFGDFLRTELPSLTLDALALADPQTLMPTAVLLRDASFYWDTRAVDLINDLSAAVSEPAATNDALKQATAHNVVARYADIENKYQRFITGRSFGDMIVEASQLAAAAAVLSNATPASIRDAVMTSDPVIQIHTDAINTQISAYRDSAATNSVDIVVNAIIDSAGANASTLESVVAVDAEKAGLLALANEVPRYALQVKAPTADYTAFITSAAFSNAVSTAARAAALAAVKEAKNDPFHTVQTLKNAAKIAAVQSITTVYAAAARAKQTELPLEGVFAVGAGDSRLISSISNQDAPLGSAALTGTIYLPASHPTNPFRHRRHPDHTVGLDIQRNLRLDFDAAESNQLTRVSVGVDQISGTYREELFGLHKPLGPDSDIGLKVEGKFELNRVSFIDTLNSL